MSELDTSAPFLADAFPDAAAAGRALRDAGLTVAVAESCTGGLLGAALTAIPGSSDYVCGGIVAYADSVKVALLGVRPETLAEHGAVSAEVATQMAEGARARLDADVGLGITGVAGPDAESELKPAGLVFVAVASAAGAELVRIDGDRGREPNRAHAVHVALRLCRERAEALAGKGG